MFAGTDCDYNAGHMNQPPGSDAAVFRLRATHHRCSSMIRVLVRTLYTVLLCIPLADAEFVT